MLPTSMAMPSAGSTVPSTWAAGNCTTKMSSDVSVRTFTKMLKPSPKKALVSPRVQSGIFSDPSVDPEDLKPGRLMGLLSLDGGRGAAGRRRSGELCGLLPVLTFSLRSATDDCRRGVGRRAG